LGLMMNPEVVNRYSGPVPRYTSYPTAVQFSPDVGHSDYADWLANLPDKSGISLYLHIPYCQALCWYCACATKAVRRYEPVSEYLVALEREVATVADLLPKGHKVGAIHWGGGTPTILRPDDVARLIDLTRSSFHLELVADFAVEIDPRFLDGGQVEALRRGGITRVSVGVQDFDERVQIAVNRQQSFETTRRAVEMFREIGIASINIDLIYGLPGQTLSSVVKTILQVLTLKPERIAVFGYAHVPHRAKHQTLIDASALPGVIERYNQRHRIAELLVGAGYRYVGIDHFALPGDALASKPVSRNFQGYTTDDFDATIGLGATAIGQLPDGYVQNAASVADYIRRIGSDGLATARGIALGAEDRMRAFVIERLMCDFSFSAGALEQRFGSAAKHIEDKAREIVESDRDSLVEATSDGFRCTELGRAFVRAICARFDEYWTPGTDRHALAV
jgi:oxygen-independent coproporphyrinogen-3 oxidase